MPVVTYNSSGTWANSSAITSTTGVFSEISADWPGHHNGLDFHWIDFDGAKAFEYKFDASKNWTGVSNYLQTFTFLTFKYYCIILYIGEKYYE